MTTTAHNSPYFPAFAVKFSPVLKELSNFQDWFLIETFPRPLYPINFFPCKIQRMISTGFINYLKIDGRFCSLLLASENCLKYEGLGTQFILNKYRLYWRQIIKNYCEFSISIEDRLGDRNPLYFRDITRRKNFKLTFSGYTGTLIY